MVGSMPGSASLGRFQVASSSCHFPKFGWNFLRAVCQGFDGLRFMGRTGPRLASSRATPSALASTLSRCDFLGVPAKSKYAQPLRYSKLSERIREKALAILAATFSNVRLCMVRLWRHPEKVRMRMCV
mmetsp:Transcript_10389/g.27554  ORF Transcript_10389/g.27554 Transcript_10389/m.27554 type:complete len:128 (+) Transcript_10389:2308-2691(+)